MDWKLIPDGEEVDPRMDRKWSQMNRKWIPEGQEVVLMYTGTGSRMDIEQEVGHS